MHWITRTTSPILPLDKPWEREGTAAVITVLPDNDILRMYYRVAFRNKPANNHLCVAFSKDGYTWQKPDLGDGHNIVMRSTGLRCRWGVFMPTRILFDPHDPRPEHRWKMVYWERPTAHSVAGICLAVSPDGYHWSPISDRPVIKGMNDAMSMIDVRSQVLNPIPESKYIIYQQTWKYNPDLPCARDNLKGMHRRISLWTATSFNDRWRGPVTILEPDAEDPPDVQFYWLTPFHRQSDYGGLLFCHHTGNQSMDIQLVTSDDGWLWQRANNRQPILPVGAPGGFDCGMVTTIAPPVLWHGTTFLYYAGRATVHDGALRYPDATAPDPICGIGLATFPATYL